LIWVNAHWRGAWGVPVAAATASLSGWGEMLKTDCLRRRHIPVSSAFRSFI